ncbi:MAG: peptidyl-prolyl cis-trans isomerase [Proteobacteria bacterium]|jgi:peptidyl-prolyl cis-trans isomerase B (cyclophilin B)|nr:peptidyl-prolyl cis-trans isomerase [Pseudomonadota bacterium]
MRKVKLVTNLGEIVLELDDEKAPVSTKNMLDYVQAKHYDGTIFHRVIDGFMIQGGGYDQQLRKRPTRAAIANEAANGLKNLRGTVAMARTADVDSATSQFFINVADNAFLDHKAKTPDKYGYAVVGRVSAGLEVVDAIKAVATGSRGPFSQDCPQQDVVIQTATVAE